MGFGPISRSGSGSSQFSSYSEYTPDHIPEPGAFLTDHEVLVGREHCAFHRLARELFEDRGVYDMTFGYNLARLNLDQRHSNAGFRYAIERSAESDDSLCRDALAADDPRILRAEFTPTTEFCPQSDTLGAGAFRAFNGERERHEYDLVRVRVDEMHHGSESINEKLAEMEQSFVETGELEDDGAMPDPGPGGRRDRDE